MNDDMDLVVIWASKIKKVVEKAFYATYRVFFDWSPKFLSVCWGSNLTASHKSLIETNIIEDCILL